ncbi:MAG: DUF3302 domain-containing protein [Candidatus Korobacteraceae bacterium]
MLGFQLDRWDYITFASIFLIGAAFMVVLLFMGSLPGRIAIARKHPEAEAVKFMGWAGLFTVLPWIQALGWAFKPTDVVDIRYFPRAERKNIEEERARLKGEPTRAAETDQPTSPADHSAPPQEGAS